MKLSFGPVDRFSGDATVTIYVDGEGAGVLKKADDGTDWYVLADAKHEHPRCEILQNAGLHDCDCGTTLTQAKRAVRAYTRKIRRRG